VHQFAEYFHGLLWTQQRGIAHVHTFYSVISPERCECTNLLNIFMACSGRSREVLHMYICISISIQILMHIDKHICTHTHRQTCIYTHPCTYTRARTHTHAHTRTHIFTYITILQDILAQVSAMTWGEFKPVLSNHIHTYTHTHAHTHTHTYSRTYPYCRISWPK
jgi:hypothetical protein